VPGAQQSMLTGQSQDWPLSREEKQVRLLRLYDRDLEETDRLLQMSSRGISNSELRFSARARARASELGQENLGDSFNASPALIPGTIDDGSSDCSASCSPSPDCKASPLEPRASPQEPRASPQSGAEWYSSATPPVTAGASRTTLEVKFNASCIEHMGTGSKAHPSLPEDAHSSQGGGSTRSFEYLTPEPSPRTPPGYHNGLGPLLLRAERPISAPAGVPNSGAGANFSVCKRTGTVIPSIPAMPPQSLLRNGGAVNAGAMNSCLTPPPCQVHDDAAKLLKDIAGQGLPEVAPLPRQRPHSAAALSAFSASSSSRRKRSEGTLKDKELTYPPFVFSAARHGRYAEVENALLAGFVPNFADSYGNTVFHIACQNGKRRIAKLAVKFGCDLNAQNMKGHTGLHFLFAYGYPDIAEYFIKKGADEFIKNEMGKTAREGIK